MGHLKNMFFSQQENFNTENYYDAKKLTMPEKFTNTVNFVACKKMSQNPP